MEDSRTAAAFNRQFSTEEASWDYLVTRRGHEGFRCPDCESPKAWLTSNTRFRCGTYESAVSVTTGTIFQDTLKSLRLWFQAMRWVLGHKKWASAVGLNRVLGMGSEWQVLRGVLYHDHFADCATHTVYARLFDEGLCVGSVRTMYRLLAVSGQSRERRHQCVDPAYAQTYPLSRSL